MRLYHLLTPAVLASSALAGPWFRRADTSSSAFPSAPTAPAGVAGQYCPNFGYSVRCSVDAECPSNQKCVSGSYLNGTDTANCAGQCYSPEPSTLPACPSNNGIQSCRGGGECPLYSVCIRTGAIGSDRDACSGTCGAPYLGGCPRPDGSGGTICGVDSDCAADQYCQFATRTGDGCSGYCAKRNSDSSSSSAASSDAPSSVSTSTTPTSTSSVSSAPSASGSAAPAGTYCGNFGFDQICSVTDECGTGYDCVPKEQNGTTTAGCSGVCRYAGVAVDLPTCPYNSDSIATCRTGADCGPYSVCNKSGPVNADRSACNGLCGSPNFGPCPRNNTDGSRSCSQDSQCGETQRCGPGTRGVPCSGTCIDLPKCKSDAGCNPDIYTSYGLCAPNGFCYQFSDCRNDRKSCPGGICGNNSPNATSNQDGYLNRTTPFICIFNATSSSMPMSLSTSSGSTASMTSTASVKPTGTKPEPTSKGAEPASSDKAPAPTSQNGAHPVSSDKTPAPTSGPTSQHPAPVPSDGSKPAPSSEHPAPSSGEPKPTPSSDKPAASSDDSKPAPSSSDNTKPEPTPEKHTPAPTPWTNTQPSSVSSHAAAPSASASGSPKPVVPVMCMGLSDIAEMLKEIKADIAQLKVDVAAIRAKTDQLDVSGKEEL